MLRGLLTVASIVLGFAAMPAYAQTLAHVRQVGSLACGVVSEPEDWNKSDLHGGLAAFDVEICKAVAVAALGEKATADVKLFNTEDEAGTGLKFGTVDLVLGMTQTLSAEWGYGIVFGPPVFYDGQGVMVRHDAPVRTLAELAGLRVCFIEGTENEQVLLASTVARGIPLLPFPFQEEGEMDDGLAVRHCDAVSAYVSKLAVLKAGYPKQLGADVILPVMLSLAPDAPAFREGDAQWARIVGATVDALVQVRSLR